MKTLAITIITSVNEGCYAYRINESGEPDPNGSRVRFHDISSDFDAPLSDGEPVIGRATVAHIFGTDGFIYSFAHGDDFYPAK